MGLLDLLLVAVGLSMDAFAVSVCKGLNTKMHPVKTGLGRAFPKSPLCAQRERTGRSRLTSARVVRSAVQTGLAMAESPFFVNIIPHREKTVNF